MAAPQSQGVWLRTVPPVEGINRCSVTVVGVLPDGIAGVAVIGVLSGWAEAVEFAHDGDIVVADEEVGVASVCRVGEAIVVGCATGCGLTEAAMGVPICGIDGLAAVLGVEDDGGNSSAEAEGAGVVTVVFTVGAATGSGCMIGFWMTGDSALSVLAG